jgi:hypothetical protein
MKSVPAQLVLSRLMDFSPTLVARNLSEEAFYTVIHGVFHVQYGTR